MRELIPTIAEWRSAGKRIAVATVVSAYGSAPRREGARLIVSDEGELAGSVSGGCVEGDVLHQALEVLECGGPRLLRYAITDEMIWRTQTILIRLLGERMPEVRTEVEQVVAERLDVAKLVETRLGDMDKADFERLLRGIFEEDEWILVVIGGVLGGLVGLLQAAVVLAL